MNLTQERNARIAEKMFRHVREGTTDLADRIVTFDPVIYNSPELAQLERERIFQSQPMCAAHSSELRSSGDFLTVRLNTSSVLLTRKSDGKIGAYLNACRHRGATLCSEDRGRRKLFTCPYHGWVYSNDGALRNISFQESFGETPDETHSLVALPVEERHGFIWVLEDPEGTLDLARHLGPEMDRAMAEFDFGAYHHYSSEVLELPQNWKIMADGLLDGYHVRFVHGATISQYVHHNIMTLDILTDHAFSATPRKKIDDILDEAPGASDLWGKFALFSVYLCPNTQLVIHPHHTEYWTIYQHPSDPSKCRVHLRFLTPRPVESETQRETIQKNYEILMAAVINEDVPAGNGVQASSAMFGIQPLRLGRNEILNQLFHRNYARLMKVPEAQLSPA